MNSSGAEIPAVVETWRQHPGYLVLFAVLGAVFLLGSLVGLPIAFAIGDPSLDSIRDFIGASVLVGFLAAIGALLTALALRVRVTATSAGLTVQNLFRRRVVTWDEFASATVTEWGTIIVTETGRRVRASGLPKSHLGYALDQRTRSDRAVEQIYELASVFADEPSPHIADWLATNSDAKTRRRRPNWPFVAFLVVGAGIPAMVAYGPLPFVWTVVGLVAVTLALGWWAIFRDLPRAQSEHTRHLPPDR